MQSSLQDHDVDCSGFDSDDIVDWKLEHDAQRNVEGMTVRKHSYTMVLLSLACTLSGCSSLSPHIFSDGVAGKTGTPGRPTASASSITLEYAYSDARQAQQRYIAALTEQGNAPARLSAALITLSGVAIFQGLTSPDSREIAATGTAGSALWGLGSMLLSKPRLEVYRAGAEAMSCALIAVEPLRAASARLGTAQDAASDDSVYGLRKRVEGLTQELGQLVTDATPLLQSQDISAGGAARTKKQTGVRRVRDDRACYAIRDEFPARRQARINRCRNVMPFRTVPTAANATPPREQTETPPAALVAAVEEANAEIQRAKASVESAWTLETAIRSVGPALWHRSIAIQLAVSAEIDKTTPDVTAALRAAQGMASVSSDLRGIFGGTAQVPNSGTGQGALDKPTEERTHRERATSPEEDRRIASLRSKVAVLAATRAQLDEIVRASLGVTDAATRAALNACSVRTTGVELKVSPSGEGIPLALGSSAAFTVTGGSGPPTASVVDGPKGSLATRVEAGQFRVVYTPPAAASVGDLVVLRFADGASAADHFVSLRLTAQAIAPSDTTNHADVSKIKPKG